MNIKERFGEENFTAHMDSLYDYLKTVISTNTETEVEVKRIIKLIRKVRSIYTISNFEFVSKTTLTQIDASFKTIRAHITNLIATNVMSHAQSYDPQINTINLYINAIEIYSPKKHRDLYGKIGEVQQKINDINFNVDSKKQSLDEKYNLREKELNALETKIKLQQENTLEISSKLGVYTDEMDKFFKTKDSNFQKLFTDFSNIKNTVFEEYYSNKTNSLDKINEIYKVKYEELLENGNEQLDRMKTIAQIVASTGSSAKYSLDAGIEKKSYERWRSITLVAVGLLVLVSIFVAWSIVNISSEGYEQLISKFVVFTSVGTFIAYASKVASGHRKEYLHSNQLALEHATFEPFIQSLEPDEKKALISSLAPKYFGNTNNTTKIDETDEEVKLVFDPNSKVIESFIKYFKK